MHPQIAKGIDERLGHRRWTSEVEHRVDASEEGRDEGRVGQIRDHGLDFTGKLGDGLSGSPQMSPHADAGGGQGSDCCTSDEASCAGNEHELHVGLGHGRTLP